MSWVKLAGYSGLLLIYASSAFAQNCSQPATAPPPPPPPVSSPAGHVNLYPPVRVEEKVCHRTNAWYTSDLEVTVKDALDHPLPGATVEFTFPPEKNPSAVFDPAAACAPRNAAIAAVPGNQAACAETKDDGIARIKGLRANKQPGDFLIRVKASFGGETTDYASIKEHNELPPFFVRNRKKLLIIGAASVAVAITVVLLRPSPQPTATIGSVSGNGPVVAP